MEFPVIVICPYRNKDGSISVKDSSIPVKEKECFKISSNVSLCTKEQYNWIICHPFVQNAPYIFQIIE